MSWGFYFCPLLTFLIPFQYLIRIRFSVSLHFYVCLFLPHQVSYSVTSPKPSAESTFGILLSFITYQTVTLCLCLTKYVLNVESFDLLSYSWICQNLLWASKTVPSVSPPNLLVIFFFYSGKLKMYLGIALFVSFWVQIFLGLPYLASASTGLTHSVGSSPLTITFIPHTHTPSNLKFSLVPLKLTNSALPLI